MSVQGRKTSPFTIVGRGGGHDETTEDGSRPSARRSGRAEEDRHSSLILAALGLIAQIISALPGEQRQRLKKRDSSCACLVKSTGRTTTRAMSV